MITPKIPKNESERLKALNSYNILDSLKEEDYDNLTEIAAQICGTKISLVSFIDKNRQWFKSKKGLTVNQTSRKDSFCAHAIVEENDIFLIPDTRKDERFFDNPLVIGDPNIAFYAGVNLKNKEGFNLGTLCVIDDEPKQLDIQQIKSLRALSKQVVRLMELRRTKHRLNNTIKRLEVKNKEIEKFAHIAAHDLKSPLVSITSLVEVLEEDNRENLSAESLKYMDFLKSSASSLRGYIDGILDYYKNEQLFKNNPKEVNVERFLSDIKNMTDSEGKVQFQFSSTVKLMQINISALQQILINLVTNGIKYNCKKNPTIYIDITDNFEDYLFRVEDNGDGMTQHVLDNIFELFYVGTDSDKNGNRGNGIGMATVYKIIKYFGGDIDVSSIEGKGSIFQFNLPKTSFL